MSTSRNDLPNFRKLSELGESIYHELKNDLQDDEGKYIAIEFDSKDYFIGSTREEAVSNAKAKYPSKLVFVRRIGPIESISRHVRLSQTRT